MFSLKRFRLSGVTGRVHRKARQDGALRGYPEESGIAWHRLGKRRRQRHLLEDRDTRRILEVQHYRALVTMQILEVGTLARATHVGPGLVGILDLDDIRTPVRKLTYTGGTGTHPCQVKNGVIGENITGWLKRHDRPCFADYRQLSGALDLGKKIVYQIKGRSVF